MTPKHLTPNPNKLAFWLIFSIIFIDLVGFGIVFPILPEYIRQFNLTGLEAGLILGIYSLMQFIFAPVLGQLSDKIGRRPVLCLSIIGTALGFFLMAFADKTPYFFAWFIAARAIDGIAGSSMACAQAYIADLSPKEQRTRNLGMWIGAAFGLGFAIGPVLGYLLSILGKTIWPEFGSGFVFLAAGVLASINALFVLLKLPESIHQKADTHQVGKRTFALGTLLGYLKKPVVGNLILGYALVIFAFAFMETTITWMALDFYKLDENQVYWLFAYIGLMVAYGQGSLVRKLGKTWSDQKLALTGAVLLALSLALFPANSHWLFLIGVCGLLCIGESLAQPSISAAISKASSDSVQGEAMGVNQSLASLSRFLGPLFAAWLYAYGQGLTFWVAALLMIPAIWLVYRAFNQNTAAKPIEQF